MSAGLGSKTFWSFASLGSRLAANFAVLFAQAKLLGAVNFGYLAYALSCAAIAALFLDLGSILHGLRSIAADPSSAPRQIRADLKMRVILVPPLVVVTGLVIWLSAPVGLAATFAFIYAGVFAAICSDYNSAILRALGHYSTEAVIAFAINTIYALLAVGILLISPTVFSAGLALLVSRALGFCISTYALAHTLPALFKRPVAETKISFISNLAGTLPYAKDVILSNSMNQIDVAMAGWIFTPVELGSYAVASRVFQVTNYVLAAMANVFIPSLAASGKDRRKQKRILAVLNIVTVGLATASCVACALGGQTLQAHLGKSYGSLGSLWLVVGIATAARVIASGTALSLTGSGLQYLRVRALAWGLPTLVVLGIYVGRQFGLAGYLWAGAASFSLMTILQVVSFHAIRKNEGSTSVTDGL